MERPLLISQEEQDRVHIWVAQILPSHYDREFIADTIILNSWLKQVPHISREYVRNKCISAWRTLKREQMRNENASRLKSHKHGAGPAVSHDRGPEEMSDHKSLIQEAVGPLSNFERRLIWMRYFDDQTMEEISGRVKLRRDQVSKAIDVAIYKMRVHLT